MVFDNGALYPFGALALGMVLMGMVYSTHFSELRVLVVEARGLPLESLSFPPDVDFMVVSMPKWSPHHIPFRGYNPVLQEPLVFKCAQAELVDLSICVSVKNRDRLVAQRSVALGKLPVDKDIADTLAWYNLEPAPKQQDGGGSSHTVTIHSGENPSPKNDGLDLWALKRQAETLEAFELSQALRANDSY